MARLPRKQPVRGKRPPRDKAPAPMPKKPIGGIKKGGSKMSDIIRVDPKTMRPPARKRKPSKPMPPRKNKPSLPGVPRKRPLRKLGRGMARMVK